MNSVQPDPQQLLQDLLAIRRSQPGAASVLKEQNGLALGKTDHGNNGLALGKTDQGNNGLALGKTDRGSSGNEGLPASGEYLDDLLSKEVEAMLSRAAESGGVVSATIQKSVSFHLEAAFQTEDGRKFNLTIDAEMRYEARFAAEAYGKQTPQPDDYWSPEKTSDRIVDFAMGFLGAFQGNHGEEGVQSQFSGFFDLARKAIEDGFEQAKGMLGAFYGEPAEKTWDLVQEKLDGKEQSLLDSLLTPGSGPVADAGAGEPAALA